MYTKFGRNSDYSLCRIYKKIIWWCSFQKNYYWNNFIILYFFKFYLFYQYPKIFRRKFVYLLNYSLTGCAKSRGIMVFALSRKLLSEVYLKKTYTKIIHPSRPNKQDILTSFLYFGFKPKYTIFQRKDAGSPE